MKNKIEINPIPQSRFINASRVCSVGPVVVVIGMNGKLYANVEKKRDDIPRRHEPYSHCFARALWKIGINPKTGKAHIRIRHEETATRRPHERGAD